MKTSFPLGKKGQKGIHLFGQNNTTITTRKFDIVFAWNTASQNS